MINKENFVCSEIAIASCNFCKSLDGLLVMIIYQIIWSKEAMISGFFRKRALQKKRPE